MKKNYEAPEAKVISLQIDECVMGEYDDDVTEVVSISGDVD